MPADHAHHGGGGHPLPTIQLTLSSLPASHIITPLLWRTSTIKALTISAQFLVQQLHSVTVTEYSYISVQQ